MLGTLLQLSIAFLIPVKHAKWTHQGSRAIKAYAARCLLDVRGGKNLGQLNSCNKATISIFVYILHTFRLSYILAAVEDGRDQQQLILKHTPDCIMMDV